MVLIGADVQDEPSQAPLQGVYCTRRAEAEMRCGEMIRQEILIPELHK